VPEAQFTATSGPVVDIDRPSVARVYDFLLGGSSHWSVDRSFALRILREFPEFRDIACANRMFVNRAVRHLARRGVRQFIDVGSGVLSTGNTHQIADQIAPCRVVYVDNELIAVAHAELLLDQDGDPDRHVVINADLREPERVWHEAVATGVLNPTEPVAILMFSVLHHLRPEPDGDDEASRAMAAYRELMPTGSYLGISHVTHEGIPEDLVSKLAELKQLCREWCHTGVYCRSRSAIRSLLGDFEIVSPGMVWTPDWHPEEESRPRLDSGPLSAANHAVVWAGVGRKQ
jgi:hypothetical protein